MQKIVGFKSVSSEVYFWRVNLDEISPGQIGYCASAPKRLIENGFIFDSVFLSIEKKNTFENYRMFTKDVF